MAVSKADLIKQISISTEITQEDISIAVNAFFECIKGIMIHGDTIEIRGFGTFIPKIRKPHIARNPKRPQETVLLPERIVPVLRFSSELKAKLEQKAVRV